MRALLSVWTGVLLGVIAITVVVTGWFSSAIGDSTMAQGALLLLVPIGLVAGAMHPLCAVACWTVMVGFLLWSSESSPVGVMVYSAAAAAGWGLAAIRRRRRSSSAPHPEPLPRGGLRP